MKIDMSPIDVQRKLAGVRYPATGIELAEAAESHGAPPDLVQALRDLGDRRLDGPDEVMGALR